VEPLGDSVIPGKAPHGTDLISPRVERFAELYELRQAGLPQLVQSAEEAGGESKALFAGAVFLQQ
jgi:hypothetical protein